MPHDVIDNHDEKLVDHIRRILPGTQTAKLAVGYFFVSGLEAVADRLYNVERLQLLIGNTTNRETIEQIAEGYRRLEQVQRAADAVAYPKRTDKQTAVALTAETLGQTLSRMDQTHEAETLVRALVDLISAGRLEVRVYTQGRLHAKAYIFDYAPLFDAQQRPTPREERGIAIVGSSNFTLSGIVSNTELNVVVHGNDNHAALTRWFEALWEEAEDFEAHLMQELKRSWALDTVTPYDLYLKTLYELVRDQLEGMEAAAFLWRDDIAAVLTEFQERAVRQAVQMIRRYGGCFVADVVGLGKSYIGAAIVKYFERQDRARSLIICPAPLVEMWEHYNEAYQLNARVLSMGQLREDEAHGPEWMLHDERYAHRDFILIDESHNFRNTDTQRYRVLQSFLATGDRRVVFLTATPRNKSIWDIYNQIKLFHQEETTELPVDPPHLRDYFRLVEAGERRLPELLSSLLIRRRRLDVLRWYGYDAETEIRVDPDNFAPYRSGEKQAYVLVAGRKQVFPERHLQTIEYSIEAVYGGLYDDLRSYLSRPDRLGAGTHHAALTYARYGLWHYVKPARRDQPPYVDLKRAGANLGGLMRVMLFKRFESSVYAFRKTVQKLLQTHRAFVTALDAGLVAAGEAAQNLLYASDYDEEQALVDALEAVTGRYHPADFDIRALRADVVHDIEILERMLALVEPITPERDDKLQTLKLWLARPGLRDRKILIFTQYADTAQYLYDNLLPHPAGPNIDVIYSQDKNKANIVGRFAPRANPHHRPVADFPEIETLIATDVLSEGLNLQDCDSVINYDLHWNPVRLIQRFGRIDRIGTEHDRIYAYNFLPERELEKNLGLYEKLRARIQDIHDTIGEDAAILDPTEQLNEDAMYTIYAQEDVSRFEEDGEDAFVDLNEALEMIRQLKEDQPDLYRRITGLRDGVRCGYRQGQPGTVVLCRAGRYQQLLLVDAEGQVVTRNGPRILSMMKCAPDEAPAPLPDDYNARVMAVKAQFEQEVRARRAEQKHTLALTRAQRYVLAELRILYAAAEGDLQRQIVVLENVFRRPVTRPAIREALNRVRRENLTGQALVDELSQLYHMHRLADGVAVRTTNHEDENGTLPYIVCSEGWVQTPE